MKKQYKNNTFQDRQSRTYMTKGWTQYSRKATDHIEPFRVIDIDGFTIKLFWTERPSTYGHQVIAVVYGGYDVESDDFEIYSYRTGGCGYCKESQAIEFCLRQIGIKPADMHLGSEGIPYNYRKGGNYYRVPLSKIRRVK